ncbi:RNA 2',3'-cyclic phosphodiesterase [Massilibacterium senegalense]|uniref:RNA 2',3'-cyclic phosphodiesterase n=1 Tax=Massilibacterium senegalense TaxID=1632858 RepID=UPI000782394B|nr:RNA 2',3'-cyclic phosphodiesterase [Massilibacterium senegalense]
MKQIPHYFIGIEIPLSVKEVLHTFSNGCVPKNIYKTWTYKDDFHITLSFLGAVQKEVLGILIERLHNLQNRSFSATLTEIDTFGKKERPRVLYVTVQKEKAIVQLYDEIQKIVEQTLGQKETRPYTPHITIAKKWNQSFRSHDLKIEQDLDVPITFMVKRVHVYKIEPNNHPKYTTVAMINLDY